jgi:hypothetical protein
MRWISEQLKARLISEKVKARWISEQLKARWISEQVNMYKSYAINMLASNASILQSKQAS